MSVLIIYVLNHKAWILLFTLMKIYLACLTSVNKEFVILFFLVLDDKAGNLRFQSEKYKKDATYLNLRSSYAKYAAVGTIFVVLMIYVRFWWF